MRPTFLAIVAPLLLLAASTPTALFAQGGSKGVVAVTATGPGASVAAGTTFRATVTLAVKGGYHVNANKPSEDYLIGTSVDLTAPAGVKVVRVAYPSAKMQRFSFSDTPLAVYDGNAAVVATLEVAPTVAPGTLTVNGKARFQACNDQACLPPSTVDVSFTVEVGAAAEKTTGTVSLSGAPPDARVLVDGKRVGRADASGRYTAREVEVGRRRVRVEGEGFRPWEQTVQVDAGKPAVVNVSLDAGTNANGNAALGEVETLPATPPADGAATNSAAPPPPPPGAGATSTAPADEGSNVGLYAVAGAAAVALAAGALFLMRRG